MDVDDPAYEAKMRAKSRARSQSNRRDDGVTNEVARTKAERAQKLSQRKMNRMARQGEADRHVAAAMPKHLVSPHISPPATSSNAHSSPASGVWERRTAARFCGVGMDCPFVAWSFGFKKVQVVFCLVLFLVAWLDGVYVAYLEFKTVAVCCIYIQH
jgi:hypothetical protein